MCIHLILHRESGRNSLLSHNVNFFNSGFMSKSELTDIFYVQSNVVWILQQKRINHSSNQCAGNVCFATQNIFLMLPWWSFIKNIKKKSQRRLSINQNLFIVFLLFLNNRIILWRRRTVFSPTRFCLLYHSDICKAINSIRHVTDMEFVKRLTQARF